MKGDFGFLQSGGEVLVVCLQLGQEVEFRLLIGDLLFEFLLFGGKLLLHLLALIDELGEFRLVFLKFLQSRDGLVTLGSQGLPVFFGSSQRLLAVLDRLGGSVEFVAEPIVFIVENLVVGLHLLDAHREIGELLVRDFRGGIFQLVALDRHIFQVGFGLHEFGLGLDERGFGAVDLGFRPREVALGFLQILFEFLDLLARFGEFGFEGFPAISGGGNARTGTRACRHHGCRNIDLEPSGRQRVLHHDVGELGFGDARAESLEIFLGLAKPVFDHHFLPLRIGALDVFQGLGGGGVAVQRITHLPLAFTPLAGLKFLVGTQKHFGRIKSEQRGGHPQNAGKQDWETMLQHQNNQCAMLTMGTGRSTGIPTQKRVNPPWLFPGGRRRGVR